MRIGLMIEGQEGVTWPQWLALAEACERAGLDGLFRSDHYLSVVGFHDRGSLDAWATINGLAAVTQHLRFGTLVSPATFRHPSVLAKMAVTADHISHGRIELGMGAGWLEAEHRAYGFPFPSAAERSAIFEEQIEIVHRSWGPEPFTFHGRHYSIELLDALPKPVQRPHPNLIVGGSGKTKSVAVAARWADEYNTISAPPDECRRRRAAVHQAWEQAGRDPSTLVFSMMIGGVVGNDADDVRRRIRALMARTGDTGSEDDWRAHHGDRRLIGTVEEVREQLSRYEEAGVQRVMVQHFVHDDLEMVDLLAQL